MNNEEKLYTYQEAINKFIDSFEDWEEEYLILEKYKETIN